MNLLIFRLVIDKITSRRRSVQSTITLIHLEDVVRADEDSKLSRTTTLKRKTQFVDDVEHLLMEYVKNQSKRNVVMK